MTDQSIAAELCKRAESLFSKRLPWDGLWEEIARQCYPQRQDFFTDQTWGEEYASHLFDAEPVILRRDLCNSFSTMLRPRGQMWFKPTIVDEDLLEAAGVRKWLEMAGKTTYRAIYDPKAGFVRATKEADHDFGSFGNAVVSVEPSDHAARLRFRCWHLKNCAWAENSDGEVDTLYRKEKMTARQMMQVYGNDCHDEVKKACEKDPEYIFDFKHVMLPTKDYGYIAEAGKNDKRMPFRSVHIDATHKCILRDKGSWEFRYVVPRWHPITGSPYWFSPATMDPLPLARQIQAMARTTTEALEKMVDPPVIANEKGVRGDINLFGGGITWIDEEYDAKKAGPALEILDVARNAVLGVDALQMAKAQLSAAMYVSKLQLPQLNAKTAYEVQELIAENLRGALPVYEPMQDNYNGPLLEATFSILLRMGAFGPIQEMPDALSGQNIDWSYENPLQQALEKSKRLTAFGATMNVIGQAAQVDPSIPNNFDLQTMARDAAEGAGASAGWIRDTEAVKALNAAQAKAAQAKMAMQTVAGAGQAAEAVGKGGQAVQAMMEPANAA